MSELPETSFKRTRSDADFSQRDRKRPKTEKADDRTKAVATTEVKKSTTEEQELLQYLKEWVCIVHSHSFF